MNIDREKFLSNLQMVKGGLSPRAFIEQSNCFVFRDGEVMTFNDEIACRKSIGVSLNGAIQADALMAILEKIEDPLLQVAESSSNFEFRTKRKRFWLTRDAEILLPIDKVEKSKAWQEVPEDFADKLKMLRRCVSQDETKFIQTCVHLHPEFMEACDNRQMLRCKTDLSFLEKPILVRGAALMQIVDLGMAKMAVTESWVHFKNPKDLIFSCRKYMEDYPKLDHILDVKGEDITIPRALVEATARALVFANEQAGDPLLMITLQPGRLRITGEGMSGGYEEIKKISYDGPAMKFLIAPDVLDHISENYTTAQIAKRKFKASQKGSWEYVTVLGAPDKPKEPEEDKEESEEEED